MIRFLARLAFAFASISLLVGGVTGFYSWISGGMTGWLMFIHCCIGPVFAVSITGWVALRAEDFRLDRLAEPVAAGGHGPIRTIMFWLTALAAVVTIGSIMFSMLKSVPAVEQPVLYATHRYASIALTAACACFAATSIRPRRR